MEQNQNLIIVPTYNEAENIRPLLVRLTRELSGFDVLVVDDNSPDGTAQLVEEFRKLEPQTHLLRRERKGGLAGAYIAGFTWGLARGYKVLIEMDADFSHNPKYLPQFMAELRHFDVVVGCRYVEGGGTSGWSWLRQLISRGGNIYAQLILGLRVKDLTGGYNAWKREVLEAINLSTVRSQGYAFQVELKCRALRRGFALKEVPIHFENRKLGKSKMSGRIVWEAAFRVFQIRRTA